MKRTDTHTHTPISCVQKNNLHQRNFSFWLKTNDMGVLHCSLWHVTLFLCKYSFMVRFQLFRFEWQAGLWLPSEKGILVEQSRAERSEPENCRISELEQATKSEQNPFFTLSLFFKELICPPFSSCCRSCSLSSKTGKKTTTLLNLLF